MAQETAGTIGIPVIKNEILPFVVDYSKRRQRAEELEARRRYQQALDQAKKEQQLAANFKMETGRGRLFGHLDELVSICAEVRDAGLLPEQHAVGVDPGNSHAVLDYAV